MKFFNSILTFILLFIAGSAYGAGLGASDAPTFAPGSSADVLIKADLPQGATALQFTINLPTAFHLDTLKLSERKPNLQKRFFKESDKVYNFVIYSTDNSTINTTDDYLFSLQLKANTSSVNGIYPLLIGNVIVATASGSETHLPDYEIPLQVKIPVTNVEVLPAAATIAVSQSLQLTAKVLPIGADQNVNWEVSNPRIASVDANGMVHGLSVGKVTVAARSVDNANIVGCCEVTVEAVKTTGITLDQTSIEMSVGRTITLNATITPSNATDKTVTWSSSNEAVAAVDANGMVTALSLGKAMITAQCGNVSATCDVTVVPTPAESITLSHTEVSLTSGKSMMLSATVMPADATDKTVTWSSSNEAVATVDANGMVTAINAGEAVITATCGSVSATCSVTVLQPTTITLSQTSATLKVGESVTLSATVQPEDAKDKTVTWSSSNSNVATVDVNGNVSAVSIGNAVITATCGDAQATCSVTVEATSAESVTLSHTELTLHSGESVMLTATVFPETTTNKSIFWTSSNNTVAIVDVYGKVTAVGFGQAYIYAWCGNVTAVCVVTVVQTYAESITLSQTEASLKIGDKLTLTATVMPENTTIKAVYWSSSNRNVATVDNNGNIVAIAAGEAEISAYCPNATASCKIKVVAAPVESITITPQYSKLKAGESITLTATVSPQDAADKSIKWSSTNTAVATVEQNGKVTALKPGTASIVVEALDGSNVKAVASIEVYSEEQVQNSAIFDFSKPLELNPRQSVNTSNSPVCEVNNVKFVSGEVSLTASGGGTTPRLWYNASKGSQLRVYNGGKIVINVQDDDCEIESVSFDGQQLDALSIGGNALSDNSTVNYTPKSPVKTLSIDCVTRGSHKRADITSVNVTYRKTVVFTPTPAESVELSEHELKLFVGAVAELTAVVKPENATSKAVVWTSDDAGVAMVDAIGRVTAVAEGVAVIRVEIADDTTVYDECLVRVSKQATGIEDITGDSAPYEVYDLSGTHLGSSIKGLRPGFYIIRQGTTVRKIAIN